MPPPRKPKAAASSRPAEPYTHFETEALVRPDVGLQAEFRKRRPPKKYRYDPTLDPELAWTEQRTDDEVAALWDQAVNATTIEEAQTALRRLNQIAQPSLRWAGKAERPEFTVPTLPLFVHERLSTKAILESLRGHKRNKQMSLDLYGDAQEPIADRVLGAYEHREGWVNRLILGDSVQVMNSLIEYESLGGQVQMIYMDPPYGVKFGSNFQPFVRKPAVTNNLDADMTREPEMVQAYRDTWELRMHSYLTYLRDRLLVAKDLLSVTGSIFVQIGDENVHTVRHLMDEVFGAGNFVAQIAFETTSGFETSGLSSVFDYLLWYGRDRSHTTTRSLYESRELVLGEGNASWILLPDGTYRGVTAAEARGDVPLPEGGRLYKPSDLGSQGAAREPQPFTYRGRTYFPSSNSHWKANYPEGMRRLEEAGRIHATSGSLQYRRFADDFPFGEITNLWSDTTTGGFNERKAYVVRTNTKVIARCILMTTQPGDLVLDPTCGGGQTPLMAETWGRRWIAIDVSRVPLAITRQRLLTATYPYFKFKSPSAGVSSGFEYRTAEESQNRRSDGYGIAPHVKLESIANGEGAKSEVLSDRPERDYGMTRVSGPFVVEATIPTPTELGEGADPDRGTGEIADYFDRMVETLRKASRVALGGNAYATFTNVRVPARSLNLSAEAAVEDDQVAIVFGPENGAVNERLVAEAAREAYQKSYTRLFVFGFAVEPSARLFIEKCADVSGIPATYVAVTPDVAMGDLLKNQRASQVFSVTGLPDVRLVKLKDTTDGQRYNVELLGLDTFDPATMEARAVDGDDVPAWFLDTDFDERGAFHVSQAFFPRTSAWENLRKELKGTFEDTVWGHLAGTVSEPFWIGDSGKVAVKVIDDRGNELVVVKALADAVAE